MWLWSLLHCIKYDSRVIGSLCLEIFSHLERNGWIQVQLSILKNSCYIWMWGNRCIKSWSVKNMIFNSTEFIEEVPLKHGRCSFGKRKTFNNSCTPQVQLCLIIEVFFFFLIKSFSVLGWISNKDIANNIMLSQLSLGCLLLLCLSSFKLRGRQKGKLFCWLNL